MIHDPFWLSLRDLDVLEKIQNSSRYYLLDNISIDTLYAVDSSPRVLVYSVVSSDETHRLRRIAFGLNPL